MTGTTVATPVTVLLDAYELLCERGVIAAYEAAERAAGGDRAALAALGAALEADLAAYRAAVAAELASLAARDGRRVRVLDADQPGPWDPDTPAPEDPRAQAWLAAALAAVRIPAGPPPAPRRAAGGRR